MAAQGTSTATILFTDVVGTTVLRARIGEGAAHRLFIGHQRTIGQLIARHGGRVIKTGGDGVMAAFDAASEAVNAAIVLQEALSEESPDLFARIGIAAGDVGWEDDDCFGLPAVTAERLRAIAESGEILVSQTVRLLAGDRAGDRYEHRGTIEVKGRPEPVDAFAVGWQRLDGATHGQAEARPPLPLALAVTSAYPFVGREDAVATVERAWDEARDGPGRVVLISGEAGAGKTRLAAELSRILHAQDACVLYGGCDPDLALPYQPWVQAVDHLLPSLPRESFPGVTAESLAPLASLLSHFPWPGARSRRVSVDADAERYRTYQAFSAALTESVDRWPTLLVLDDLHWAGPQTLALLRHLVHSGLPARLLLVGTFRDTADQIGEPLAGCLADLRRVDVVTRARLAGLDVGAIERFVADASGLPFDEQLRQVAVQLADRSGGNAFYLGELWHNLVASGGVSLDGGKVSVLEPPRPAAVPEGVREVVGERLARLSDPARRIVDLAALAGHRVDLQVLEEASNMSTDDIDGAITELVNAGVLVQVGGTALVYRFVHTLVRDCVVSEMLPQARARLHFTLARAIETAFQADRKPVLAELAGHYAAAGGPLDKISYYGRRAAGQAMRAAAYDEARSHLSIVLEHTPRSAERSQALVELAAVDLRDAGSTRAEPPHSRRSRSPPSSATPRQQPTPLSPTSCPCTSPAFLEGREPTCSALR